MGADNHAGDAVRVVCRDVQVVCVEAGATAFVCGGGGGAWYRRPHKYVEESLKLHSVCGAKYMYTEK